MQAVQSKHSACYKRLVTQTNLTKHRHGLHPASLCGTRGKACSAYGNDAARLSVTCHSDRCAGRTAPAKLPFRSAATLQCLARTQEFPSATMFTIRHPFSTSLLPRPLSSFAAYSTTLYQLNTKRNI